MQSERDEAGRFTTGNPGGPGRPRRAVELDYLAALGDALTLADWREIVTRAVTDAKAGDKSAREWVGRYALGAQPFSLIDLARREALGVTPDDEMDMMNVEEAKLPMLRSMSYTPAFISAAEERAEREQREREQAEYEAERAARAAKRATNKAAREAHAITGD